ncbi:Uma2 family endonuclease [Saccharopolyspora hattusasensis]|uniref:Uma2 family endonuclease n=1 Tax=Saccharopolyspora hattusasensis TaxID=1128679 RepID=UPI003D9959B6
MTVMNMRADEHHVPMTVDDLERLPDDGRRYELVDGSLDVSPSPAFKHSDIESRLHLHLGNTAPDEYRVLQGAGYNFNGDRTHHRIPDLSVIRVEDSQEPYLTRPPLLAIEVVSPSSALRDYHTKTSEYAKFGIAAYWIVNPTMDEPVIVELRLEDGDYREVQQVLGAETFETDFPFQIKIVPRWLADDGPWRRYIGGEGD